MFITRLSLQNPDRQSGFLRGCALILVLITVGCGPAGPSVQSDYAQYDGVYFQSGNHLESYDKIVVLPERLTKDVKVKLPDGSVVAPSELTMEYVIDHQIRHSIGVGGGQNGERIMIGNMQVLTLEDQVVRVVLMDNSVADDGIRIVIDHKEVAPKIRREKLEQLIGKPDLVKRDASPPGE